MSTSPVLVPISLVSQFLANEKMASRHWLQCQMECLLDQVFDQLSTKFEDYLASNAITGTEHHTTIHSETIQHQHRHQHDPSFQVHSHTQFQVNGHLNNSELRVAVGQSQIQVYQGDEHVMNSDGQMNLDRIDSEALMYHQPPYPLSLCVQTSNQELSNQHYTNEEHGLAGDDDQSPDDAIDYDAARIDSDEPVVKKEFDDTNHELITKDQVSSSLSASSSNQSNHNLTNGDDEDEDDCDCDDCRNGIEVKEEGGEDDAQTIEDYDEEYDLDGGSRDDDEQPNGLEYGDNSDDSQMNSDEGEVEGELDVTNSELSTTEQPQNPPLLSALDVDQSNQNVDEGLNGVDDRQQNEQNPIRDPRSSNHVNERIVHDEERSRPRKKPRLETTELSNRQSRVTRQSSRLVNSNQTKQEQHINEQNNFDRSQSNEQTEPTEEVDETNQVNNQNSQIITIRVQCHHTGCPQVFNDKTELNLHMSTKHGILPHQCLVNDCKQSFNNKYNLGEHVKQVHSTTTRWHCDKCAKHYPKHRLLSRHHYFYHQLGLYKCSFSNCTFTGDHRQKVFDHYKHHKLSVEFRCKHPNCGRRFNDTSNFKRHQHFHLGIKPYRCKWPRCGYAATQGSNTIEHIRRRHLKQGSSETSQVDPREYLEIVR